MLTAKASYRYVRRWSGEQSLLLVLCNSHSPQSPQTQQYITQWKLNQMTLYQSFIDEYREQLENSTHAVQDNSTGSYVADRLWQLKLFIQSAEMATGRDGCGLNLHGAGTYNSVTFALANESNTKPGRRLRSRSLVLV